MADSTNPQDVQHYLLTTSLDRELCFRRVCPACGRPYKTKVDADSLAYALQPAFRQMGVELGANSQGTEQTKTSLYCPYCRHFTEVSETLTPQLVRFLHRYATREIVLPQIHKMFSGLENTLGRSRTRSKGFISIEVKFEAGDLTLPPRPISGPEPPDMMYVTMLCCNKYIKIMDGWKNTVTCPYCGIEAVLQ